MWHELQTFKMFDFGDVAGKEDEAERLRYFQDNINGWLSERSKMTKEEIDEKIHKQEWWMTGEQTLEYGFVDYIY